MAVAVGSIIRPPITADYRGKATLRSLGFNAVGIGITLAMVGFISSLVLSGSIASGGSEAGIQAQAAWTFGIATAALGATKLGIALILWGIVRRIWIRIQSVKESLPLLVPEVADEPIREGRITTPYGKGTLSRVAPGALPIHRMAYALWLPMVVMGAVFLGIGLVLSFLEAQAAGVNASAFNTYRALTPGFEFLGEGLLLSGISFLLGSILGSLRQGGGEVQEAIGRGVKTLAMPLTAKLFVLLMAMGMMIEMVQFVLYIVVSTQSDPGTIAAWLAWLGPFREAGLGLLLSGIVLALVTIGNILGFQFTRIRELIAVGR